MDARHEQPALKTNRMATISLALGICSLPVFIAAMWFFIVVMALAGGMRLVLYLL